MGPGVRRDDQILKNAPGRHIARHSMTSPKSASRTALSAVTADTAVTSLLTIETFGRGFINLTGEVRKFVRDASAREGVVTLFIRHTSASLTIQENADPSVLDDLMTALDRLAPEDGPTTAKAPTTCRRMSNPC
jgi:hypothetical protein